MATHKVKFKRVVEYEADGKRWRKVTGAEAKQYAKVDAKLIAVTAEKTAE